MASRRIAHLPDPPLRVPYRHVRARLEGQSKEAVCGVERSLDDVLELQIRLDRCFLDIATPLSPLFPVITPVPCPQRGILAFPPQKCLQRIPIPPRTPTRPRPDAIEPGTP